MSDLSAVLAANDAFYRAFATGDFAAMDALWARHSPVACLHPGWGPIAGRAQVMETWRAILANSDGNAVQCLSPQAYPLGDAAFVICHEKLPQGSLVATNLFVREGDAWRMVHHQAGPAPAPKPAPGKPIHAPGTRTLQ
ncbi:MAG: nuclear transport factor 2 family protein [Hyphomicrobiales bacterium]|nr:nuclear transport factor 2 family protein [Hyphomicrobiales bacterium]